MALVNKKSSRGFDKVMAPETASAHVTRWVDEEINVKLTYGPNRKRTSSKSRARYARYMKATSLVEYINCTGGPDNWTGRPDLVFDLVNGLVTATEPK